MSVFVRFVADERAVGAVKYGLIAACLSLAIVTVLQGIGGKVMDALAAAD